MCSLKSVIIPPGTPSINVDMTSLPHSPFESEGSPPPPIPPQQFSVDYTLHSLKLLESGEPQQNERDAPPPHRTNQEDAAPPPRPPKTNQEDAVPPPRPPKTNQEDAAPPPRPPKTHQHTAVSGHALLVVLVEIFFSHHSHEVQLPVFLSYLCYTDMFMLITVGQSNPNKTWQGWRQWYGWYGHGHTGF